MISLWKFVCGWRYRQHHTHFDQTPATGLLRMSLLQQRVSVNSQDSTVSRQNGRMSFRLDASKTATICSDMVILNRCETSKTLRLHRTNWCLFQPFTASSGEVFQVDWRNTLTDGKFLPAVYAWLDLGGEALYLGDISLEIHL